MTDKTFSSYKDSYTSGDDADDLWFSDGFGKVYTNDGDDFVGASSDSGTLFMGEGNDSLWAYADLDYVDMGDGDDLVYLLTSGRTDLDGTTDIAYLNLGDGDDVVKKLDYTGTITQLYAGDGDDKINLDDALYVSLGNGDDTLNGDDVKWIDAGDGDDTIYLQGSAGRVNLGKGDDTATIEGDADRIDAGKGDDNVEVHGDIDTVYLSRTNDSQQVGVSQRTDDANRVAADHFHSIHSNAGPPEARSIFVLWPHLISGAEPSPPYNGGRRWSELMGQMLGRSMRAPLSNRGAWGECDFYGASSCRSTATTPKGSRNFVQSFSLMPSALSEASFHSNPTQNQRIMNADW